jgi:hypothetical protein
MILADLITKPLFVFDVESIGLHGDPFAVGVVVMQAGAEIERKLLAMPRKEARGLDSDRVWVDDNVPPIEATHSTLPAILNGFWHYWMLWKARGAVMCADCAWPVEANFLAKCVALNRAERAFEGPYPLIEISSIVLAAGGDPMETQPRDDELLPRHHPVSDSVQSARMLWDHLIKLSNDL